MAGAAGGSSDRGSGPAVAAPGPATVVASDVFVSYARENRDAAQQLADALAENRLHVWWDRDLEPGSEFAAVIEAQLGGAAVVVGLWSQDSVRSAFVRDECAWALRADKLVPVRIEEVDLPLGFGQLHTLDLLDWDGDADDAAFQALLLEIERRRGQRLASEAAKKNRGFAATLRIGPRATRRALLGAAVVAVLGGAGYYVKHTLDRREADQHFRAGLDFQYAAVPRLENALNEYLSALERLPGHARARYYLGHVYAQTGRNADALASFRLALSATEALLDRGQRLDAERQLVALAPEADEAAPITRAVAAVSPPPRPARPPATLPVPTADPASAAAASAPKSPPRTEPSTPAKDRLARSVAAMFDENKDRRIVATTSLVVAPDDLSDAVPLAVERALAALRRAPPLPARDSSGVVNTLVLLQSALPGTLAGNRGAIEELLAAADGAGDYTRLQAAKVRDRLQQAAKAKPVGYLQIAGEAQRPLAEKISEWLRNFGYAAPAIEVVGTRAPARTELRVQGKSDRSHARWLTKVVTTVTTTPPTLRVLRNANPQVDTYEIWLGRDLCAAGGAMVAGCES